MDGDSVGLMHWSIDLQSCPQNGSKARVKTQMAHNTCAPMGIYTRDFWGTKERAIKVSKSFRKAEWRRGLPRYVRGEGISRKRGLHMPRHLEEEHFEVFQRVQSSWNLGCM